MIFLDANATARDGAAGPTASASMVPTVHPELAGCGGTGSAKFV